MKSKILKTSKSLFSIAILVALVLNSCEKDKEEKLQLPPELAFLIDLSPFSADTKTTAGIETGTRANITYAAGVVFFWDLAIIGVMALPTAAYVKAFEYQPQRVANNKWKWSYSVPGISTTYTADLYGEIVGAQIQWEMYISQQGGFTNWLMFDGVCNTERTEGYWKLYEYSLTPAEVIRIDWTYNWEEQTGSVKYTYTKEGTNENGNYLEYGLTTNTDFNAFYNLYNKSDDKLFNINYNTTTHEGNIEYDANSYCWDSLGYDVDCAE